uniref:cAMP-dependent protein kinase regulatory subunit-like n=1 Tax=Dermatophagoides pteronyssinus TaxID=6956 RepID=A0A6P6YJF2_DERPT|nr:cAMP-dependent protein kinase regulatory subunit-like [Dermatophagoides pteronyssinus]
MFQNTCLVSRLKLAAQDIIISALRKCTVKKGTVLIKQGEQGDALYLVASGSFDVFKTVDDREEKVNEMTPGQMVGELSLLYDTPRAATVVAREDSCVYKLDRQTFNSVVKASAREGRKRYLEFLKRIDVLQGLKKDQLEQLADVLSEQRVPSGKTIVEQGEKGSTFYLLAQGSTEARKMINGQMQTVKKYEAPAYFGELSLLARQPVAANVVATSDCVLLGLDVAAFYRLMGPVETELLERSKHYSDNPI